MKNLILGMFLSLILVLPLQASQENTEVVKTETPEIVDPVAEATDISGVVNDVVPEVKKGFFGRLADKIKGNALEFIFVSFIAGIFTKHGWSLIIKKIASRGKVILKEVSELSAASSNFLEVLDGKIAEDGSFKENTLKDCMSAGKPVIAEFKDAVLSIKPKV